MRVRVATSYDYNPPPTAILPLTNPQHYITTSISLESSESITSSHSWSSSQCSILLPSPLSLPSPSLPSLSLPSPSPSCLIASLFALHFASVSLIFAYILCDGSLIGLGIETTSLSLNGSNGWSVLIWILYGEGGIGVISRKGILRSSTRCGEPCILMTKNGSFAFAFLSLSSIKSRLLVASRNSLKVYICNQPLTTILFSRHRFYSIYSALYSFSILL